MQVSEEWCLGHEPIQSHGTEYCHPILPPAIVSRRSDSGSGTMISDRSAETAEWWLP